MAMQVAQVAQADRSQSSDDPIIDRRNRYLLNNLRRVGIAVTHAKGSEFTDSAGKRYLDLFPGFGSGILGHCHPELVAVATEQAAKLWHVGADIDVEAQGLLAEAIAQHGFGGRSYIGLSGSEANEAAFKLARLYGRSKGDDRYKIIATHRGFHGRGFAAMMATSGDKARKGFEPFLEGFSHVPYNDLPAMAAAVDDQTVAIIVEPIQGEGGVHPPDDGYLAGLRELCDEHDLLLICDEVWTGCGRTGEWFAYQHSQVKPDIMTLGKAVGCGFPVSIMCADERIAGVFDTDSYQGVPHVTTLTGSCVPAAVSARMFEVVDREGLVDRAREVGGRLAETFRGLSDQLPLKAVRGKGLFVGLELDDEFPRTAPELARTALDLGLHIGSAGDRVLRIAPPLNVTEDELDRGLDLVVEVLKS